MDNPLPDLKTVYASEFNAWGRASDINSPQPSVHKVALFASEQEYSFCKAVCQHPMQHSSNYPKLARISSKKAKQAREQLIAKSYIREHRLDSGGRGRSSILLEVLPKGVTALQKYEETTSCT